MPLSTKAPSPSNKASSRTKSSSASTDSQRMRWVLLGCGAALVLATAIVQGLWSDRWTDSSADSQYLAERIDRLPLKLGDWQGEDIAAAPRELRAAGAVGHLSRIYRNRLTGEQVSLFLICGHMRHVSVHTPDRCYPANGFEQQGEPQHFTIKTSAGPVETFTTTFRQEEATGVHKQRVFWTWGYEAQWQAPDNPRVTFGGVRALYKLYLITSVPPSVQQPPEESPALHFAQDTFGEINALLFADKSPGE
jgi:hypothetical protein